LAEAEGLVSSELLKTYAFALIEKWQTGLAGAIAGALAWYAGLKHPWQTLVILLAMVALDTVTGVMAARKEGRSLEDGVTRRVCEKITAYLATAGATFLMLQVLATPREWKEGAIGTLLAALVAIEFQSVLKNITKLRIERLGPFLRVVARISQWPLEEWRKVIREAGKDSATSDDPGSDREEK
jgi:hypothetical protein